MVGGTRVANHGQQEHRGGRATPPGHARPRPEIVTLRS
jgi:hypothetical protein